jgi:hypothetical protein
MIRRLVGKEYWLIAQDDHAQISGMLARSIGGKWCAAPTSQAALEGIRLHDSGWPIHDENPTLNVANEPRDVFESTWPIALPVWQASAERAAQVHDYAGLLVSLHSLALSVFATGASPLPNGKPWDTSEPRARFEMNRFQHRMIEFQESIRARLGFRIDRPLKYGLAEDPVDDPREQELLFNFRWLQAMDQASLSICCTRPPFAQIPVIPRVGSKTTSMRVEKASATSLRLDPWPFSVPSIEIDVPFRRLAVKRFTDEQQFRDAYRAAQVERFTATLEPRTMGAS